jgi:HupE / UreJ protein
MTGLNRGSAVIPPGSDGRGRAAEAAPSAPFFVRAWTPDWKRQMDRTALVQGVGARGILALLICVFLDVAVPSAPAYGHDIPDEIILHSFVKPEGDSLHVLVRVPLTMLLNMNLPKWGAGYLDLARMEDRLEKAAAAFARDVVFYEDNQPLVAGTPALARISQPSDSSFESFESALANIRGPSLPAGTRVFWNQGYFDAYLRYPIRSDRSAFSMDMGLAPGLGDRLKMFVRFMMPDGTIRAFEFHGGSGLVVLDPRWYQAAWTFVQLGFEHILAGIDHLLFLLCLAIPFGLRHLRALVLMITAFTVAHSITLIASAMGVVPAGAWFPPLVEALIALSILYMALENIVLGMRKGRNAEAGMLRRCLIVGAFGLVHGFGFSFVLEQELQFAGDHFLLSLVSFNVGVEIGQLAFLAVALPLLSYFLRQEDTRRLGMIVVSALAAHTAWHWLVERGETLATVGLPVLESVNVASALRWTLLVAVLTAAIGFAGMHVVRRLRPASGGLAASVVEPRPDQSPTPRP